MADASSGKEASRMRVNSLSAIVFKSLRPLSRAALSSCSLKASITLFPMISWASISSSWLFPKVCKLLIKYSLLLAPISCIRLFSKPTSLNNFLTSSIGISFFSITRTSEPPAKSIPSFSPLPLVILMIPPIMMIPDRPKAKSLYFIKLKSGFLNICIFIYLIYLFFFLLNGISQKLSGKQIRR